MDSDDQVARELSDAIGKLIHGLNMYDVERALVVAMSCGICTSSDTYQEAADRLDEVWGMLVRQVAADYPRITAMREQNEVNALILPKTIQ